MFVVPAKGLQVRRPEPPYKPLPPEGAEVPDTTYWNRRLKSGDVTLGAPPKQPKESTR